MMPAWLKDFWSKHWRKAVAVAAVLVLMLLSYGGGRYAQPAKVVEKEKVVDRVVEKKVVEYQDRVVEKVVEKVVYVKAERKNVHVVTTTTKKPDGTTETKVDKTDLTATDSTATGNKTDAKAETKVEVRYVDRVVEKVVEKEKVVTSSLPGWRLSAGLGVDIPKLLGQPDHGVPGMQGFVVMVEGERRLWRPLWLGVWGTTQGSAGLKLSLEF